MDDQNTEGQGFPGATQYPGQPSPQQQGRHVMPDEAYNRLVGIFDDARVPRRDQVLATAGIINYWMTVEIGRLIDSLMVALSTPPAFEPEPRPGHQEPPAEPNLGHPE